MNNLENLRFFREQLLRAADLNLILEGATRLAEAHGVLISPMSRFEDGQVLEAKPLNLLRDNITRICLRRGFATQWSFPSSKDGDVLQAEHLNELVEKLLKEN